RATPVGRGAGGADPPEPTRPRGGGGRYRDNRGWRARPQRVHAPGAGIRRRFPEISGARAPVSAVSFSTIAQPNPRALLLIEIPESVVAKLSAVKRVPVRVTLNGVEYRSTIAIYGGRYYLPARKEICKAAKLVPGGRARVSLEVDTAPRTVVVPADLANALSTAKLRAGFDAFSFSHRKEFVDWVTSAKRAETRAVRIPKV